MFVNRFGAACGGLGICFLLWKSDPKSKSKSKSRSKWGSKTKETVFGQKWPMSRICNGILSGAVSITAGCAVVDIGSAMIIGCFGSWIYYYASHIIEHKYKIDDVLDAFAVHGAAGLWGMLATGLFATSENIVFAGYTNDNLINASTSARFGMQILGIIMIILWTVVNMTILFCTLRYFGKLRVPLIVEETGLDSAQNGVFAIFYFEQVTQPKIVYAKNLALQKAAEKDRLRRERKKQLKEQKERAIASASQSPKFLSGKRMELFLHDNGTGNDNNNNNNAVNRLKSHSIESTTTSGIGNASNSNKNGLPLHMQLTTTTDDGNNTTDNDNPNSSNNNDNINSNNKGNSNNDNNDDLVFIEMSDVKENKNDDDENNVNGGGGYDKKTRAARAARVASIEKYRRKQQEKSVETRVVVVAVSNPPNKFQKKTKGRK